MGYYCSSIMQQGDQNTPATMVRAIYELVKDMLCKDLDIYSDDIYMSSDTCNEYLATL